MLNDRLLSISIFCLSIAIVISSAIVANSITNNGIYISGGLGSMSSALHGIDAGISNVNSNANSSAEAYGSTLNAADAAKYLGISIEDLLELTHSESSGIPYIKIGYSYIFGRDALDKWLETTRFELKE